MANLKGGTTIGGFIGYHSGNSNILTVDWSADDLISNTLTVDGYLIQDSIDRAGLLEVNRNGGSWLGHQYVFSATAKWSIMGSETQFGLYDDQNSEWMLLGTENAAVNIYYNGSSKIQTTNTGANITGTLAATTVTGANVTSGANPGHTHTTTSISSLDASDTTTGVFDVARLRATIDGATPSWNIVNHTRFGAALDMNGLLDSGVFGLFSSTNTNAPTGDNYDPVLVTKGGTDVGNQLLLPRTASRGLAWRGWSGSGTFTSWHYGLWGTSENHGGNLTNLNGSNISTGTVAAARVATLNQSTTGNAATASQLYINNDDSGDTNCPILFTQTSTAGNKAVYEDSAVYIDNTNNDIYCTSFQASVPVSTNGLYNGLINTGIGYQILLNFRDSTQNNRFTVSNGTTGGGFFPTFTGQNNELTLPGLYFLGDNRAATSTTRGALSFDGRVNNGTGTATDIILEVMSGYGTRRMHMMGDGDVFFIKDTSSSRFFSTVATGTSPFTVASTTKVTNLNSDTLDGVSSGSFLRSDATDYLTATLYLRGDVVNETGYRDRGIYGNYDSTKANHIWSMGVAYTIPANGSTFGNMYGALYKYNTVGNGVVNASGHQFVWCQNGNANVALGTNVWTSGDFLGARVYASDSMSIGSPLGSDGSLYILENDAATNQGIVLRQNGTGDAKSTYSIGTTTHWTTGIDNSDGDTFKISRASTLGTSADYFRINGSGQVIIGNYGTFSHNFMSYINSTTTTPAISIRNDGTGDAALLFNLGGSVNWSMGIDNSDSDKFKLSQGNVLITNNRFSMTTAGAATFTSTVTATDHINSSDRRLKDKIEDYIPKIIDIRWREYEMKETGETQIGVIADELEKTNPEFVVKGDTPEEMDSVRYTRLLIAKVAELEDRIKKLEK